MNTCISIVKVNTSIRRIFVKKYYLFFSLNTAKNELLVQKRSTVQGNHYICKETIVSMGKSHPILIKN